MGLGRILLGFEMRFRREMGLELGLEIGRVWVRISLMKCWGCKLGWGVEVMVIVR